MISKTNISFVTEELYGLNILLYCLSYNFGTSFTLYKNGWGEDYRGRSQTERNPLGGTRGRIRKGVGQTKKKKKREISV